MISSNSRARQWFEEQTRLRTAEQNLTTLDQVRLLKVSSMSIDIRLLAKCIRAQAD